MTGSRIKSGVTEGSEKVHAGQIMPGMTNRLCYHRCMTKKHLFSWAAIAATGVLALHFLVGFVAELYYPDLEPRHPEIATGVADAPMVALYMMLYGIVFSVVVFWLPFFVYGITGKWLTYKLSEAVAHRWFVGVYVTAVLFNLYLVVKASEPVDLAGIVMVLAVIITPLLLAAGNIVLLIALLVRRHRAKKNTETALETLPS